MTLDNMFAIFLIPIFSAISDRTRTRIGRRMPFIITFLPLSAFAFGLIPFSALSSLALLIILIFALNVFKQSVRGPVVALMPDIIPGEIRSEANGVINTMGGIATIEGLLAGVLIMGTVQNVLNLLNVETFYQYVVRGAILIIAVLLDQFKQRTQSAVMR
jgi:MFS family permease